MDTLDPSFDNWGYPTDYNNPGNGYLDPLGSSGYLNWFDPNGVVGSGPQGVDPIGGSGNIPQGSGFYDSNGNWVQNPGYSAPTYPSQIPTTLDPSATDPNNPYNTGTSTTYPGGQNPTYGASGDPTFSTSPTDPMPPGPTPPTYTDPGIPPFPGGIGNGIPDSAPNPASPYPNTGGLSTTFPTRPSSPAPPGGGAMPGQQGSVPRQPRAPGQAPGVALGINRSSSNYTAPPISTGLPSSQSSPFNPIGIQSAGLPGQSGPGGQRSQSDSLINQLLYRALNPRQRSSDQQPIGPSSPSYDVDSSGF